MTTDDRAAVVRWVCIIAAVWVAFFTIRAFAPPDIEDNDQSLVAAYAVDVVANGSWLIQHDVRGAIASKPPLYQWLVGVFSAPAGRVTEFTLVLPSALAVFAQAVLALFAGRWLFGSTRLGALAAVFFLCTPGAIKGIHYARPDPLFSLCVFAATLAAFHVWTRGRGWLWFWLACAAGAMTKSPAIALFAMCGLLAVAWERGDSEGPRRAGRRVALLAGCAALSLAPLALWYALARSGGGEAVADRLVSGELLSHVWGDRFGTPFAGFLRAPIYYVARSLPWSVFAIIAIVRIARTPGENPETRRAERFLFCVTLGMVFLLGFATKPRGDHLLPLVPITCLLAARELQFGLSARAQRRLAAVAVIATLFGGWLHAYILRADNPQVVTTVTMRDFARSLGPELPDGARVLAAGAPYSAQFYLGVMSVNRSWEDIARALDASDGGVVALAGGLRGSPDWIEARAAMLARGSLLGATEWDARDGRREIIAVGARKKGDASGGAAPDVFIDPE